MDITYILQTGGVLGWVVIGVGLILCILGLVLVFGARNRSTLVIYGATAVLPLLIGLFGTWMGYQAIQSIVSSANAPPSPEMLEEGYRAAWVTTYVGISFAVLIIAIACVGVCIKAVRTPIAS